MANIDDIDVGTESSARLYGLEGSIGGADRPLLLVPAGTAMPPKKPNHLAPQQTIDDFWARFNAKNPGKAYALLPKNLYAKSARKNAPTGVVEGEDALSSYEEAARICRDKVNKIVEECRRVNQKYSDNHFNIEFDLKDGQRDCLRSLGDEEAKFTPYSTKRVTDIFESPAFFSDGATATDIRQGRDGDCWLLAALGTLGNKPGLIEKNCVARDETVGVYGFVFHRDGDWISEIIDDKLYLIKPDYTESDMTREFIDEHSFVDGQELYRKTYQTNSKALYFAQCSDPNETWLPLLEKAYAKAHGDFSAISGGFTGEGLEDLTGGVTSEVYTTDILDKEYFWRNELMKVNEQFLFGCASGIFGGEFSGRGDRKGVVERHAYSIMKCKEVDGKRFCLLRNPWGEKEWNGAWSDGSKEWTPYWMERLEHRFGDDGQFWMTYEDLLRTYQIFDRTRLFSEEWKVTQQWTSITVPWSVDYSDTKFSFTIDKETSVVIVLSQLDDRYFCGLEGKYGFRLAFRVHKAGNENYIVRSRSNYRMQRSVSAELTLEAGEYHVLMKVEAEKYDDMLPTEEVLRNNVTARREKVLRIGLSYDMAHAKGVIIETQEEKKAKKDAEDLQKAKRIKKIKEEMFLNKKKQRHRENRALRKQQAATLKRRAKAESKRKKSSESKKETPVEEKSLQIEVVAAAKPTTEALTPESEATAKPVNTEVESNKTDAETTEGHQVANAENNVGSEENSDLESISSTVSTVSTFAAEDMIELRQQQAVEAVERALQNPQPEESEDEFEADPWNAVAVVGLRIYAKGCGVTVKVVRPRAWEDGEGALDIDDSAKDATKGIGGELVDKKDVAEVAG